MKFSSVLSRLSRISIPFVLLAVSACTRHENQDVRDRVKSAYEDAKTAVADTWRDVKSYTYEKRRDFSSQARDLGSKMDSQVDDLKRRWDDSKANDRKKAALDELKRCQADFRARVNDLEHATSDTWDSAKRAAVDSWDHLKTAYQKARED
ncbi:MAG TPA: hypothetical protein VHD32_11645 [Candidatus Didemnitutus sp.]|nr:hypothetical protein [Candidatus Didemnitutus sp.]